MDYIDDDVESVNAWDAKRRGESMSEEANNSGRKVLIGKVDQFFDRINVAAVSLTGQLKVGDVVEIGDEEEAIRQKILSIQIDRENVEQAGEGDDVGIKLKYHVNVGSDVYKIE